MALEARGKVRSIDCSNPYWLQSSCPPISAHMAKTSSKRVSETVIPLRTKPTRIMPAGNDSKARVSRRMRKQRKLS